MSWEENEKSSEQQCGTEAKVIVEFSLSVLAVHARAMLSRFNAPVLVDLTDLDLFHETPGTDLRNQSTKFDDFCRFQIES